MLDCDVISYHSNLIQCLCGERLGSGMGAFCVCVCGGGGGGRAGLWSVIVDFPIFIFWKVVAVMVPKP